MIGLRRLTTGCLLLAFVVTGVAGPAAGQSTAQSAKPEGEMRWALYVTLAPAWFDPGDVVGVITPFWVLYALHDALVKPMPGNRYGASLAESWTVSPDQTRLRVQAARGAQVPQRRSVHRRGCEVQLPCAPRARRCCSRRSRRS